MNRIFTNFPVLTTSRLVLRQIEPSDASLIFDLRRNETVNKFLHRPKPQTIEDVLQIIEKLNLGISEGKQFYWVINLKNDKRVIGTICLWNFSDEKSCADIGYELHPDFQRKGLMNEAVETIIKFGFNELELDVIEAWTVSDNTASIRLLEKSNFIRNLEAETEIDRETEGENTVIYSLKNQLSG